jgi:hypothetical protein
MKTLVLSLLVAVIVGFAPLPTPEADIGSSKRKASEGGSSVLLPHAPTTPQVQRISIKAATTTALSLGNAVVRRM